MNCEALMKRLAIVTYNDVEDAVELRYILLKVLVYAAEQYNHTPNPYLLKQHQQLQRIHATLKAKIRDGGISGQYFMDVKKGIITYVNNISAHLGVFSLAA